MLSGDCSPASTAKRAKTKSTTAPPTYQPAPSNHLRTLASTQLSMLRPVRWRPAACLPGSDQCLAELGRQGLIGRLELFPSCFGVAALPPGDVGGEVFDVDLYSGSVGGEKVH